MCKARFLVVNSSSLDMMETHRPWLEPQGIELIGNVSFKQLKQDQLEPLLRDVLCVVGPHHAGARILPRYMEQHPSLQAITLASSGHEWADIEAATRNGIVVTYAGPVASLAEVVADHTWGLMLAVARQIPHHHQRLQAGDARRGMGAALWGKTLGIVGLGNIGRRVARRAVGFEMKLLACEIEPDHDYNRRHGIELVEMDELLRRSDFVSLHVRLNPRNEGMIGARELGLMKPTAYLINTARQKLVDEATLAGALINHRLAGAAIDDPWESQDDPTIPLPNVVRTPHIGNRVPESVDAVCRQAYQNAMDVVQGRWPQPDFVLNPEVYEGSLRAPHPTGEWKSPKR